MNKREALVNIGLVIWVFIVEPLIELGKWIIRVCVRFAKRYPRFTVCALALIGGGVAEWQSLSAPVYNGTPMATIWSCVGGALLLSVFSYLLYVAITSGPHPLQGTRLVNEK